MVKQVVLRSASSIRTIVLISLHVTMILHRTSQHRTSSTVPGDSFQCLIPCCCICACARFQVSAHLANSPTPQGVGCLVGGKFSGWVGLGRQGPRDLQPHCPPEPRKSCNGMKLPASDVMYQMIPCTYLVDGLNGG